MNKLITTLRVYSTTLLLCVSITLLSGCAVSVGIPLEPVVVIQPHRYYTPHYEYRPRWDPRRYHYSIEGHKHGYRR